MSNDQVYVFFGSVGTPKNSETGQDVDRLYRIGWGHWTKSFNIINVGNHHGTWTSNTHEGMYEHVAEATWLPLRAGSPLETLYNF